MTPSGAEFGRALVRECRRRLFEESLPRVRRCLSYLDEAEVWLRPNENVPSVGNLVLHLCGNVRQWIGSGLGGAADGRDRAAEFSERGPIPKADLLARLEGVLAEADQVLDRLDPETLLQKRPVQAFEESGLSILVHVVEHFSYHTGQITTFIKTRKNVDLGYYAGIDLNQKPPP